MEIISFELVVWNEIKFFVFFYEIEIGVIVWGDIGDNFFCIY